MARTVKQFQIVVTHEDIVDVTLEFEQKNGKKILTGFALSYCAFIHGSWHEVIRYDNAHGYVHVQKFWRSPNPIPLPEDEKVSFEYLVKKYRQDLVENWERYRGYIEEQVRKHEKDS